MNSTRLDRRHFLRAAGGAAALMLPLAAPATDALAGVTWCRTDPIITLNGKKFHIYVDSTQEMFTSTWGATGIIVQYPKSASLTWSLVPGDDGFGYGYIMNVWKANTRIKNGLLETIIGVYAGADNPAIPLRMQAVRASDGVVLGSAQGTANNNVFWSGSIWV